MAQHRTKKEKLEVQMRREEQLQYNLNNITNTLKSLDQTDHASLLKKTTSDSKLFQLVNPQYLRSDVIESLLSIFTICIALTSIWFYLK